jgi:biotin-dependent carboxylase-like uncharacterized protein
VEYSVAFIGFSPGFPYLLGLPDELATPRLGTPRARVPATSVAIGGRYTGIYPRATSGGWRLIGEARDVELFDPARDPPSLLQPGDRVRFKLARSNGADPRDVVGANATEAPHARVLVPGALTTIQDLGRTGWGSQGVPSSGAFDAFALRAANLCVGNDEREAALEITMSGPTITFDVDTTIALTGSAFACFLDKQPVPFWRARAVRAGQTLAVGWTQEGARCYLAVRGGIECARALGSASRHVAAELGPLPLAAGDTLEFGVQRSDATRALPSRLVPYDKQRRVRVVRGAQFDDFSDEARALFSGEEFRVTPSSNRTGVRLDGPALEAQVGEIDPEGVPIGGIQVTPDGRAIVLGPDRPITGGYPKIATVIEADIPLLAHAKPGDRLRFEFAEVEDARAAWDARERALRDGIVAI